jgi:hypothetical protein
MRYSKFSPELGLYELFEDQHRHPINADLPTPRLMGRVGNIGVPAGSTGRPLPKGAKRIGTSWRPEGQIVSGSAATGVGELGATIRSHPILALVGGALVAFALTAWWVRRGSP